MSKTLPWRTALTPSIASDRKAPSIALPCGSSTPDFSVTVTRAFTCLTSGSSGRIRRRRHGQERIERRWIAGCAQLAGDRRVAQEARAHRQRLEMVRAGRFGRDQHEDEINRQPVRRVKIDRPLQTGENSENL